jgi:cap2 methyltransferase
MAGGASLFIGGNTIPANTIPTYDGLDEKPYTPTKQNNTHKGQRKLLLSEIDFLTGRDADWCIYAGAAPNNKGAILADMFPKTRFVFVDPREFNIRPVDGIKVKSATVKSIDTKSDVNIYTIQDLFTTDMARALKKLLKGRVVFISDIRTNKDIEYPTDSDILYNSAQQFNWVTALKPHSSMLKFRLPFRNDDSLFIMNDEIQDEFDDSKAHGIDFESDYANNVFKFMDGEVRLQAWAPRSSTETRLIVEGKQTKDIVAYDNNYEDKMFYFNSVERSKNADNIIEKHILDEYNSTYNKNVTSKSIKV